MSEKDQGFKELDLEDILKEFSDPQAEEETPVPTIPEFDQLTGEPQPAEAEEESAPLELPEIPEVPVVEITSDPETLPEEEETPVSLEDTAVFQPITEESLQEEAPSLSGDTIRMDAVQATETEIQVELPTPPAKILLHPRAKLRELKRKLIAGPEKRYYELSEMGLGKLQLCMFLCFIVIVLAAVAAGCYSAGMVSENRLRLLIFSQVLAMLFGGLMGSHQMIDGISDLFHGRFTLNTLLTITFLACCGDSALCFQELRVPLCSSFTLAVMMSLWSASQTRAAHMGMMDTLRKAVHLNNLVKKENYFEGRSALIRGEGEVEDFMDHYQKVSGPERTQNIYAFITLVVSAGIAVYSGLQHGLSMAVQIFSTTLLVAVPASFFIAITRPMVVLERQLHNLGTVLCGWDGIKGLCGKALFPLFDGDLFPVGTAKMNGVKFFGDRDPEVTIAYAAALMRSNGGGLAPVFDQLLTSRNGVRYEATNMQYYGIGGIGGEVNRENVLMGNPEFLKDMGVAVPEGVMVKQAVYLAINGNLTGLFALTYTRAKTAAAGMSTLRGCRSLTPVLLAEDFMLTGSFLKEKFGISPKRMRFPLREERVALRANQETDGCPSLALITQDGLSGAAYAVTGAKALRTAWRMGLVIHMIGGILGMLIMAALAILGATHLLAPLHILLYQLVWMVPGLLVTLWTKTI